MSTHPAADTIGTTDIETTRWRIDPSRSAVEFHVKNFWGMATVKGSFSRYQGTFDLDARPAVELTVEADSLDTNHEKRDAHLRSPDFFDAERHPYVRFASEAAALDRERLTVQGRLHARGNSIPLIIEATVRTLGDELEIDATAHIDQRELGMTWSPLRMVRAPSKVIVRGRLVRE